MIDLDRDDRSQLESILEQFVPDCEVLAFGSRVTGKAKRYSDLDLILKPIDGQAISISRFSSLQEALACSDISIIIDLHDWYAIPDHFKHRIEVDAVMLKDSK